RTATALVPTTVQQPPETITLSGSTIVSTIAGQVTTIQLPGSTLTLRTTDTVVLPPSTTTLPGSTVVTTLTETIPASTITLTEDGVTFTSVIPGPTSVVTSTLTLPPITLTLPPSTVTRTEIQDKTACPAPTNTPGFNPVVDFNPKSNLTWGCQPGYVCNPAKPAGCSLWAESPANEYACNPKDCVPAPPYTLAAWKENETHYFPPNDGYFNLNPNAFGLSFDIFDYEIIVTKVKDKHGYKKTTITTGNWASATDLTHFPPIAQPTLTLAPASTPSPENGQHAPKHHKESKGHGRRSLLNKRDFTIAPAVCFDGCNNCYIEVQAVGKVASICLAGSAFLTDLAACRTCVEENDTGDGKETLRIHIEPKFQQFISFCEGEAPQSPSSATILPPQSQRISVTLTTANQDAGSTETSAVPIPDITTTTSVESSTITVNSGTTAIAASSATSIFSSTETTQASATASEATSTAIITSGTTIITDTTPTGLPESILTVSTTVLSGTEAGSVSTSASSDFTSASASASASAFSSIPASISASESSPSPAITPTVSSSITTSGAGPSPSASSVFSFSSGTLSTTAGGEGGSASETAPGTQTPSTTILSPSNGTTGPVIVPTATATKPITSTLLAIFAPLLALLFI
ncbi:uncharacterized protein LY79DRAFT_684317, partial [Colletotrichum navitas]